MENSFQIYNSRKSEMSKSQQLLLESICKCVKDKTPLLFEDIIKCYYFGVKKTLYWTNYELINGQVSKWGSGPHKEYDILVEYTANSYIWNKKIRDLIKSWFVSAIGLLVIKGWLTVLPVINID